MFVFNWFFNILNYLGLHNKKASILFLGLDNAGKTTLLHILRDDKVVCHEPTRHPQMEELVIGGVNFRTHDLGGHAAARRLWKDYYSSTDGIVYLVDCADRARFPEAKEELSKLLSCQELINVPFLILGNKIDLKQAVGEEEFKRELGIIHTTGKNGGSSGVRPQEIFMCSVVKRTGYRDGFRWLANYL